MNPQVLNLLLMQALAYVLANFIVMPNYYINNQPFGYWKITKKSFLVFILSWTLSGIWNFGCYALIIAVCHFLLSLIVERKSNIWTFIINQIVQVSIIGGIVLFHQNVFYSFNLIDLIGRLETNNRLLIYAIGYLACLGPANVLIKILLEKYILKQNVNALNPTDADGTNESLLKAGRFIGSIERIITLSLLLVSQYDAIGFLMAAKSILRIKDNRESEYILTGTLLSFGTAILIGLITKRLLNAI